MRGGILGTLEEWRRHPGRVAAAPFQGGGGTLEVWGVTPGTLEGWSPHLARVPAPPWKAGGETQALQHFLDPTGE